MEQGKGNKPHPGILPSMPSEDIHTGDSPPPASHAAPSPYDQMTSGFEEQSGYDEQPPGTNSQNEPGELSAGRILPSMPSNERYSSDPPTPAPQAAPFLHSQKTDLDQKPGYVQPQAAHAQMGPGGAGRILPSMPSQVRGSPGLSPERAAPQSAPPYAPMPPGFDQSNVQPQATYPQTEPGELSAGRILPSMPTPESVSPDSPTEPPAPQAASSPFAQLQSGFAQTAGYVQQPLPTYPPGATGGNIPPSSPSLGRPPYSAGADGTGAYSALGPSTAGMPPLQSYPRYGPYQSTYGFPYGTNASMPYSANAAAGSQAGYASSQVSAGGSYGGPGAGPMYGGAAQAYPLYGSGYPQQYPAPAPYDYHGLPSRGQARYRGNRSHAIRPGRPIFRDRKRSGPDGANLFIFHIPNEMTNDDLFRLFQPYGNVLSARIMTERDTGRGRGFGFVSYDSAVSAEMAIFELHGFEIQGKKLKVQHKQEKEEREDEAQNQGRYSLPSNVDASASRPHQRRPDQPPAGFVPVQEPVPVQEYAGPSEAHHRELTPLLPPIDDEPHHRRVPTPTLPPVDEPHNQRVPTPTLSPIDALDEGSEVGDHEGPQSYATPPSPLANMEDIGKALPDPK